MASTSPKENGSTLSCKRESAFMYEGGTKSARVEINWPNLTKVGPSFSRSAANSFASAGTGGGEP
ncbi:hypothetical protein [Chthoniobacter flavus]|nr:hypothetical protein [Chthoniobacter flavus]